MATVGSSLKWNNNTYCLDMGLIIVVVVAVALTLGFGDMASCSLHWHSYVVEGNFELLILLSLPSAWIIDTQHTVYEVYEVQ